MTDLVLLPDVEQLMSVFLRAQQELVDLTADRVYTILPADPVFPAVRVVRWGGSPVTSRPLHLDRARLQIDVWGGTKGQARAIAETIRAVVAMRLVGSQVIGNVTAVEFGGLDMTPDGTFDSPRPRARFDITVTLHP